MIPENSLLPKNIARMLTTDKGKKGKLFLIVGPSGAGKGTILRMLRARHSEFRFGLSATTRPPRSDDLPGEQYVFVNDEGYDLSLANNEFLTSGHFYAYRYGSLYSTIRGPLDEGRAVLKENDTYDWHAIKASHPELASRLRTIFFVPPSIGILEERIRKRSFLSEEQIAHRMASAPIEMETAHLADLQVVTVEGEQEKVYETVERYILSELER